MELYLDTSDVAAVKKLARIFPLAGVTTNPSIVAAGKTPLDVLLPALHDALGGKGRLFAQVMATTAEGMVEDARKLRAIINDLVVKVPVTAERAGGNQDAESRRDPDAGHGGVRRRAGDAVRAGGGGVCGPLC